MTIHPYSLKQIKGDALESLRLMQLLQDSGGHWEPQDWKLLNTFIGSTKTLNTLDLAQTNCLVELVEGLKKNRSITALKVDCSTINQETIKYLFDALKENTTVAQLNLDDIYLQEADVHRLSQFLERHQIITHIHVGNVFNTNGGESFSPMAATALMKSPNILSFESEVESAELSAICQTNREAAIDLIAAATNPSTHLSSEEIGNIQVRTPAILYLLKHEFHFDQKAVAQFFVNLEDTASNVGVAIDIPEPYVDIAVWLPRPFLPADIKINFSALSSADSSTLYGAVEAGQVDELMGFLHKHGKKLTAVDCLLKPEGKKENLIELVARQGKLASVMTVANWIGDPRSLKQMAEAVPAREWRRQMKDMPVERLVSLVNAASLKTTRPQQMRFG